MNKEMRRLDNMEKIRTAPAGDFFGAWDRLFYEAPKQKFVMMLKKLFWEI